MKKHSIEAQRLLDELDAELAANGAAAGRSLGWSASERQIISMAADAIDRGVELAAAYAEAVDVKDKIKVSREIRLQEMWLSKMDPSEIVVILREEWARGSNTDNGTGLDISLGDLVDTSRPGTTNEGGGKS